jgi:hypothetical protein
VQLSGLHPDERGEKQLTAIADHTDLSESQTPTRVATNLYE